LVRQRRKAKRDPSSRKALARDDNERLEGDPGARAAQNFNASLNISTPGEGRGGEGAARGAAMWWESGGLSGEGPMVDIGRRFALHSSSAGSAGGVRGTRQRESKSCSRRNHHAKAKGRKAAAKHLHKGKKLEAQKPLKGAGKVEYMKYDLNDVLISGIQHS